MRFKVQTLWIDVLVRLRPMYSQLERVLYVVLPVGLCRETWSHTAHVGSDNRESKGPENWSRFHLKRQEPVSNFHGLVIFQQSSVHLFVD